MVLFSERPDSVIPRPVTYVERPLTFIEPPVTIIDRSTIILLDEKSPQPKRRWRLPRFPWHIFTTKRVLNGLYGFCTITALTLGLLMTILALKWIYPFNGPQPGMGSTDVPISKAQAGLQLSFTTDTFYLNLILAELDIFTGLGVGVLLIASFFMAMPAFMSSGVGSLIVLNFGIALDILTVIAGGTIIWYRDLQPRENLWKVWLNSPIDIQATIQDQFQCCGWWDPTDLTQVVTNDTCPSTSLPGCVGPFGNYADHKLNGIFTFVYGVVALLSLWFLVNGCIISERRLQHRFRLIDQKQKDLGYV